MIEEVRGALDEALKKVAGVVTLDELRVVDSEVLGKRGALAQAKTKLGALAIDDRKTIGQAINEAMGVVSEAVEVRRSTLAHDEVNARIVGERIDLTEVMGRPTRGHPHLVTQAWDRLEALQKEVRQPLTDWENREKNRIAEHEAAIAEMASTSASTSPTALPR